MLGVSLRLLSDSSLAYRALALIALALCACMGLLLCAAEGVSERLEGALGQQRLHGYDILVLAPEPHVRGQDLGSLASPHHVTGIAGGVNPSQLEAIRSVPGVEVAAPIALLGYYHDTLRVGTGPCPSPGAYAVRCVQEDALGLEHAERTTYHVLTEEAPGGLPVDGYTPGASGSDTLPACYFDYWALMAAIDPEAEAALLGLDDAVRGTYLGPETPVVCEPSGGRGSDTAICTLPVLFSSVIQASVTLSSEVLQLSLPEGVSRVVELPQCTRSYLESLPVAGTVYADAVDGHEAYQDLLRRLAGSSPSVSLGHRFQVMSTASTDRMGTATLFPPMIGRLQHSPWVLPSPVEYRQVMALQNGPAGLVLEVVAPEGEPEPPWLPYAIQPLPQPWRALRLGSLRRSFRVKMVGTFDVNYLQNRQFLDVPVEIYAPAEARYRPGTDGETIDAASVGPGLSPLGFMQGPPTVLTTLEASRAVFGEGSVSAVRIRVADSGPLTPDASARIEDVAAEIRARTGLEVQVVVGSSPTDVLVRIPGADAETAGGYVEETWLERGVGGALLTDVARRRGEISRLALWGTGLLLAQVVLGALARSSDRYRLLYALGWRASSIIWMAVRHGLMAGLGLAAAGVFVAWIAALNLDLPLLPDGMGWAFLISLGVVAVGATLQALVAMRPRRVRRSGRSRPRHKTPRPARWPVRAVRGLYARRGSALLTAGTAATATATLTMLRVLAWDLRSLLEATALGRMLAEKAGRLDRTITDVGTLIAVLGITAGLLVALSARRSEIGLLKAFGWRTPAVLRATAAESIVLVLVGCAVGGYMGAVLPVTVYGTASADAVYAAQQAGLAGFVAMLLGTAYAVIVSTRVSPIRAMGGSD